MKKTCLWLFVLLAAAACLPVSRAGAAPCNETLQYDDGTADDGNTLPPGSANPSAYALKFVPCAVPYKFTKFAVSFTRGAAASASLAFTITMWKNAAGVPGDILDTTTATANDIPIYPAFQTFEYRLPNSWAVVPATESSVFLGIQVDPAAFIQTFVGFDQNPATPVWPSFAKFDGINWYALDVYFAPTPFSSLVMRAEGSNCIDSDGDGYGAECTAGSDCDDNNAAVHAAVRYFRDMDGDGLGNQDNATSACSLTPPDGYVDNSSGFDVNDADPFLTDVWPSCDLKVIPRLLGWLLGERQADRLVLIVAPRGVDFNQNPAVKWESGAIASEIKNVFFKRLMLMKLTIDGADIDQGEYRVLIGSCIGSIRFVR
jgi:hypothetical protein